LLLHPAVDCDDLVVALRHERDPALDPFREGVATLRTEDGQVAGYLAAIVDEFWSPGRPLTWQERVWWLVTWSDGRRDRIEEDYPPWIIVDEVRRGRVELETTPGAVASTFIPEWLEGEDRADAWRRYGIRGAVEDYM
jgi:hypothetical protein